MQPGIMALLCAKSAQPGEVRAVTHTLPCSVSLRGRRGRPRSTRPAAGAAGAPAPRALAGRLSAAPPSCRRLAASPRPSAPAAALAAAAAPAALVAAGVAALGAAAEAAPAAGPAAAALQLRLTSAARTRAPPRQTALFACLIKSCDAKQVGAVRRYIAHPDDAVRTWTMQCAPGQRSARPDDAVRTRPRRQVKEEEGEEGLLPPAASDEEDEAPGRPAERREMLNHEEYYPMLLPFRRPEDEGPEDEGDEEAAPADGTIDWAAIRVRSPASCLRWVPEAGVWRTQEHAASARPSCLFNASHGELRIEETAGCATYWADIRASCGPWLRSACHWPGTRAPRLWSAWPARRRSAEPRPRSWGCGARRRRRGRTTPAAPRPRRACSCCRCPTGCPRARRRRRRTRRPRACAAPSSRTSRRAASRAACASASSARCALGLRGLADAGGKHGPCWTTCLCRTAWALKMQVYGRSSACCLQQ